MKSTADIVIIGGGIQGLSLAYYLAVKGQTDLLLLERNALGSGSSGRSAAIIGLAFPSERCLPLTCWSYAALMRFEEEVGASPDYQPVGCLLIAGARGAPDLRRRHALLRGLGIESYLLDPLWEKKGQESAIQGRINVGLYDYLSRQVLDQQPPALREFLLDSSILDELSPELCSQVLEVDNPADLIDQLRIRNLFIIESVCTGPN